MVPVDPKYGGFARLRPSSRHSCDFALSDFAALCRNFGRDSVKAPREGIGSKGGAWR